MKHLATLVFALVLTGGATTIQAQDAIEGQALTTKYLNRSQHRQADKDQMGQMADLEKASLFSKDGKKAFMEQYPTQTAAQWIKKGDDSQFYTEKLRCYNRAIQEDPNNTEALFKRAQLNYKNKQFHNCQDDLEKLLLLDPNNKKANKLLKKANKKAAKAEKKERKKLEKEQKEKQKQEEELE